MNRHRDSKVQQARQFAMQAHGKQRYGDHPYIQHLDDVAEILGAYSSDAMTIAYLHDVLEDTSTCYEDIHKAFGKHIAEAVALLTDEPGPSRTERKKKTHEKLSAVPDALGIALIVKAADRLANVRACIRDRNRHLLAVYMKEHVDFYQSVYRNGLCEEIWRELNKLIVECVAE